MEETYELPFSPEVFILIVLGASIILCGIMWAGIFKKAGQPVAAAFVPIYNIYIMTKVAGKPGYWTLLFFIPLVNIVFQIWLWNMVSKSFGKEEGFTVGLVLLSIIFFPILSYGGAKYLGPYGDPAAFAAYQEKNKFDFENRQ